MFRSVIHARKPVAADAIMVGLIAMLTTDTFASANRTPTMVLNFDRSRELTPSERKAMDCVLSGRTLHDVIRLLGSPDHRDSNGRGHLRLSYWLGRSGNLKIDFLDGVVSGVAHNTNQTGVSDDDGE